MTEDTFNDIVEEIEWYKSCSTTLLEDIDFIKSLIRTLENKYKQIIKKEHICPECKCYQEVKSWEEYHPCGDTHVPEKWSDYFCPKCKKEAD